MLTITKIAVAIRFVQHNNPSALSNCILLREEATFPIFEGKRLYLGEPLKGTGAVRRAWNQTNFYNREQLGAAC